MNEKRALVVCQRYPLPENHGNPMRTMNFIRAFSDNSVCPCNVDIVYSHGKSEMGTTRVSENEFLIIPENKGKSIKKNLWRLLWKHPSPMFIYSKSSKEQFRNIISEKKYDYILFRYLHSTQLAFQLRNTEKMRTIIDVDDVPSENLYDMKFSGSDIISQLMAKVNRVLLQKYEKRCMGMGATLFCSKNDRDKYKTGVKKDNLFVVPNIYMGQSFSRYDFGEGAGRENVLLFVGALDYEPNVMGLKWFIEVILSSFKRQYPDARLIVVGRNPGKTVKQLCGPNHGIELHANVPDIRPFYKKCKAVVVPLLSGGGTRIKILEAALSNRPIFSTPLGAAGLNFVDDKDIHLFTDEEEFVQQYQKIDSVEYYRRTVENAKAVATNCYSMKRFREALEAVMRHIDKQTS